MSGSTAKVISASHQFMPQHDKNNSGKHEDIFKDRHHAGGKHFIQRVHVSGDARHQSAHGIPVIEADVHVLQVAENLAAEIEHDFLPGPLHEIGLRVFQSKADQQQRQIGEPSWAMPTSGSGLRKRSRIL